MRYLYNLQGSWGSFGITNAMLRRCKEMSQRGIECYSLSLDLTENLFDFEEEARVAGRIDKESVFQNPYLQLAESARLWFNQTGNDYMSYAHLVLLDSVNGRVTYYSPKGEQVETKEERGGGNTGCLLVALEIKKDR